VDDVDFWNCLDTAHVHVGPCRADMGELDVNDGEMGQTTRMGRLKLV
jgi:hypothetical protein